MREKIRDLVRDAYDKINYYNSEIEKSNNATMTASMIAAKTELYLIIIRLEDILKAKSKK